MPFTITIPILIGLGLRILSNVFLNPGDPVGGGDPSSPVSALASNHILLGAWIGIFLYHLLMEQSELLLIVALAVVAWLAIDFVLIQDTVKTAALLLGAAVGVLCADVLSRIFIGGLLYDLDTPKASSSSKRPSHHRGAEGVAAEAAADPSGDRRREKHRRRARIEETTITPRRASSSSRHGNRANATTPTPSLAMTLSTDPDLDLDADLDSPALAASIPKGLSPIEHEIALLRRKASVAEGHTRRCREERRWALDTKNRARAEQLTWQVRRFRALAESFAKEADDKLIAATMERAKKERALPIPGPELRPGPSTRGGATGPSSGENIREIATVEIGSSQANGARKRSSSSGISPLHKNLLHVRVREIHGPSPLGNGSVVVPNEHSSVPLERASQSSGSSS